MHIPVQQFDYVIVGGGSAGAVLAARLTENPMIRVCLVEAGGKDNNPFIHIPFGLSLLARFDSLGWGYYTEPQTALNDRELFWPRGKTLGGSSSINAMCYIRGQAEDYDNWAKQGASGWDFASVLPYFKRAENFCGGSDEFHGAGGPLDVNNLRHTAEISSAFVEAAQCVNLPVRTDFNRREREGLGFYHVTQRNGQRCSAAKAYLSEARQRGNLTILTSALAERVLIKQQRATGVQVRCKGKAMRLMASREVILSAGAINSPHLLMLSGIGPAAELQDKGIYVQQDLPGVGKNLQDHLDAIVQYRTKKPVGYPIAASAIPRYAKAAFRYLFKRDYIFSSNVAEAGGFVRSSQASDIPDIQFHFLPAILQDHGRRFVHGFGYGLHVCALYPKSRGEITLQSNHPADHPAIQPNYLAAGEDLTVMKDAVNWAQTILRSSAFAEYEGYLSISGHSLDSDEDIEAFIRERAETIYHPVGTCKMGAANDPMAVVDTQLKVKNIAGLRVVDASVMPSLVGGNTNAPTIMIAERAAEWIRAEQM
ncbi:GMC family oxidoreductase [Alteromonas lipolytica]|uniref:GMC family oxidoreductase n=1 Tax=Alteromonas lipolytica TaxID=1856405 RepID=A0A1E8FGM3_9ALTE|nr:choline dehydrogenase [Alteromonas lipolytica]OFI34738.1 GMC family oxidoreductase [Alteromonas lipolytica]GGF53608.1 choline dehydrogenase [Alteromonas lipolytica]